MNWALYVPVGNEGDVTPVAEETDVIVAVFMGELLTVGLVSVRAEADATDIMVTMFILVLGIL